MNKLMIATMTAGLAVGAYAGITTGTDDFEAADFSTLDSSRWVDGGEYAQKDYAEGEALDGAGSKYLHIDDAVTRTIADEAGPAEMGSVYIDTLVKFTAVDADAGEPDVGADAKLAIWLKDNGNGTTNLMVTCGKTRGNQDCGVTPVSVQVTNAGTITDQEWHRLVVKTVGLGAYWSGFYVFVDGSEVTASESLIVGEDLEGVPTELQSDVSNGKIFPSLITANDKAEGYAQISSLTFSGSGDIDNVTITNEDPIPPAVVEYNVTITAQDNTKVSKITLNGEEVVTLAKAKKGDVIAVTFAPVAGYELKGEATVTKTVAEEAVEITGPAAQVIKTPVEKLSDAISAAASGSTVALTEAVTGNLVFDSDKTNTIDLAGYTWNLDSTSKEWAIIRVKQGKVIIVDSSADKTGKMVNAQTYCVWCSGGAVEINAGTYENDSNDNYAVYVNGTGVVTINGGTFVNKNTEPYMYNAALKSLNLNVAQTQAPDVGAIVVKGGSYTAAPVDDSGIKFVAEGYKAVESEGVWTVRELVADVAVTVTAKANTSVASIKVNGETVKSVETATEDDVIEVTFAADKGYTLDGDATVSVTVGTTAATIEGPTATKDIIEVTPQITLSAMTAEFSDSLALPTVTVAGDYVLDTDYTVAWDKELPTENPAENVILTVTVTMKGDYTGSNTATFTVTPKAAAPTVPEVITGGSTEQKSAYDTWAAENKVTGDTTAALADAFALGVTVKEGQTVAEAAAEKIAEELPNVDMSELTAGNLEDAVAAIAEKYPNATVQLVEATELESTDTAKFFKLKVTFKPAN